MPDPLVDFVADRDRANLERLFVARELRLTPPDDLFDWILEQALLGLRYQVRNREIAAAVASLPGRSTWARCERFLAMARANDPEMAQIHAMGLRIPSSVDQIYRIVRAAS